MSNFTDPDREITQLIYGTDSPDFVKGFALDMKTLDPVDAINIMEALTSIFRKRYVYITQKLLDDCLAVQFSLDDAIEKQNRILDDIDKAKRAEEWSA